MSLWVDKYRPNMLSKLDYHCEQAQRLEQMVSNGNFPHLLVYGPPGAGKKTRIMALLRELYGAGVEKLRMEHQSFTVIIELFVKYFYFFKLFYLFT